MLIYEQHKGVKKSRNVRKNLTFRLFSFDFHAIKYCPSGRFFTAFRMTQTKYVMLSVSKYYPSGSMLSR